MFTMKDVESIVKDAFQNDTNFIHAQVEKEDVIEMVKLYFDDINAKDDYHTEIFKTLQSKSNGDFHIMYTDGDTMGIYYK